MNLKKSRTLQSFLLPRTTLKNHWTLCKLQKPYINWINFFIRSHQYSMVRLLIKGPKNDVLGRWSLGMVSTQVKTRVGCLWRKSFSVERWILGSHQDNTQLNSLGKQWNCTTPFARQPKKKRQKLNKINISKTKKSIPMEGIAWDTSNFWKFQKFFYGIFSLR